MQAVLFDLDGTLLDIDIEGFLDRYFIALDGTMREMASGSNHRVDAMDAVMQATGAMMRPHPNSTNEAVFCETFDSLTGLDIRAHWGLFDSFYANVFPTLRGECRPLPGVREALAAAREAGLRVAVATNPIFPLAAIKHRLSWAEVDPHEVDVITSFENMSATKPYPDYYRHVAGLLGVQPSSCLMVGDDRMLDMPAADIGMRTFYVGEDADTTCDYRGDLVTFARELPRLIGR